MTRPSRVVTPTGDQFDMPAGPPVTPADRTTLYYAQFDEMDELTNVLKQARAAGVAQGYALGLSAFGEMDPDRLIAIVRSSPAYSAYLRTNREWAAIYLGAIDQQQQRAVQLVSDIEGYLERELADAASAWRKIGAGDGHRTHVIAARSGLPLCEILHIPTCAAMLSS